MDVARETSHGNAKNTLKRILGKYGGRHLLGAWDTEGASPRLGAVLILLAELCVLKRAAGATATSMAFLFRATGMTADLAARVDIMIRVARAMRAIENCVVCTDVAEAARLADPLCPDSVAHWPTAETQRWYRHESMDAVQDLYDISGIFPLLEFAEGALAPARRLLDMHAPGFPRIAMHLKMSEPIGEDISNANMSAWGEFFEEVGDKATFILVASDPIPDEIKSMKNVLMAERLGANAVDQLALIRLCDAFMGMASGPCQIAIFGRKPYAVFKNPRHHAAEMTKQLRRPLGFSFSLPTQFLIQQKETLEVLYSHYEILVRELSRGTGGARINASDHE